MVLPKLQEKVQCVRGERKLNFSNEITEILVQSALLEMKTNCGNGIAKIGGKKNLLQLVCGNAIAEIGGKNLCQLW